jgi:putative ABC transport system permease protein
MWRVTIRGLMAKKLRLLTTALAIMLGVAFMAGTLVLTDTMGKVFDDLFADVNRGTDAFVRGPTVFKSDFGDVRSRIPASLVTTVEGAQGVKAAEGSVQGYAQLVKANGKALSSGQAPNIGSSWGEVPELNPWTIIEGHAPTGTQEIVIDEGSAKKGDFTLGQRVKVLLKGPTQEFTIAGIAKFGTADSPAGATFVGFAYNTAQKLLAAPGEIDSISAVADAGVSQQQLAANIQKVVPSDLEVLTGAQITKENQNDIKQGLKFFNTFLLVFAGVAVFVGMFIIYNTFSILVAQRGRELALLRAIGASRRQVLTSVLVEGIAVGVIASLVGFGLGILVALGLTSLLSALGFDLPSGSLVVLPRTVIVSLIVGVSVTVVSAFVPARRASRIPPVAAMRDVAIDTSASSRKRAIVGVIALAIGGLLLAAGLAKGGSGGAAQVGLSALVVFLAATILGPIIARPVSKVLGAPLPKLRGMSGTLAKENAARNPRRTASTAAALMIGVGIVGFILVLAASVKQSIADITNNQLKADYIINSTGGFNSTGFSPELASQITTLPEVQSVSGMRFNAMQVDGSTKVVFAIDPNTIEDVYDFVNVTGSIQDLNEINTIAVDKKVAEKNGWSIGTTIPVTFASETTPMKIAVLIDGTKAPSNWGMSIATYENHFADQFDSQVFIKLKPGADTAAFEAGVDKILLDYPTAQLQTPDEFKASAASQVNQIVQIIYALLFLAIIIALLGIANTLALSIYERRHEIGLLRAVGMTRRQVRSAVRWEAVIIALLGTGLGLVIGVTFGAAIVRSLRPIGFTGFSIPIRQLVIVAILAAIAGVVAAILPARKAAKLNILESIATE